MRIERHDWDGRGVADLAARLRESVALDDVGEPVAEILAAVGDRGDEAVRELEERFGAGAPAHLRIDPAEVRRAAGEADPGFVDALELAAANIARVAEAELRFAPEPVELGDCRVSVVERPVGAAAVYAPGGRASYPSSVLMCALPARVAGVRRIAVASPPGDGGGPDPAVLTACSVVGVDEVYAIGGAQAIGALALGTESVRPVDVIAGPGNRYVTEAKRQVFGRVGIDALAGPTELVVVADGTVEPRWLALDLLAQAEHGSDTALFLVSAEDGLLDAVERLIPDLAADRASVADAALASVRAPDLGSALELCDALSPEHLELALTDAGRELAEARTAGCVFTGPLGGAAFGDYVAGSNHVLPTSGAARFSGPLGPRAFMRRSSVVEIGSEASARLAPAVDAMARAEGFPVHGESALARAGENRRR
jgi:histidinol dehydrogenase